MPRATALGVIPWSPLAGGMLGGIAGDGDTARRKSAQPALRDAAPAARAVGEALRRARRGAGRGRARVAAAAPASVTAPIIGPRTLEQLEGASLRAIEIELDDDDAQGRSTRSSPAPADRPRGLRLVTRANWRH